MTQAYPLHWPAGWPRTTKRETGNWRTELPAAVNQALKEVKLIGGTQPIISSNFQLAEPAPADPGVAVYFLREGTQVCIPCDRWKTIAANLRAVAATLENLRAIERWGAKHMVTAAFRGFAAISPPGGKPWREILRLGPAATRADVEKAFKQLATERHPDAGGSDAMMAELNAARDQARKELGG